MYNYLVYKTINTKTQKEYIGVHKQIGSSFDGYYGSSKSLQKDINELGKDFFKREILYSFKEESDAYTKEEALVDSVYISRKDTYNKVRGGKGGTFFLQNEEDRLSANIEATKTRLRKYGDKMGKANNEKSLKLKLKTKYFNNIKKYPNLIEEGELLDPQGNLLFVGSLFDILVILYSLRNAIKYRNIIFKAYTRGTKMQSGRYKGYTVRKVESSTTSAWHVGPEWVRNGIYASIEHKDIVYSVKKLTAVNSYRKVKTGAQ